jgi:hypothetical protein
METIDNPPETVTSRPIRTSENEEVEAPQQKVAQTTPVTPNIAPPSEETPAPKPAPVEPAPKTVAETETAPRVVSPVKPVTQPVVATDDQISRIDDQINYLSSRLDTYNRAISHVPGQAPALKSKAAIVKNRIDMLERQKQDIFNSQQRQANIAHQKNMEEQGSPEGKAKIKQAENYATKVQDAENDAINAAARADDDIMQFEIYRKAIAKGIVPTGFGGEVGHIFNKAKVAVGYGDKLRSQLGDDIESGAVQQMIDRAGGRLSTGVSNEDSKNLLKVGISLGRDAASNVHYLEALQNAARRNKEHLEFIKQYKQEHGRLDENFLEADAKWRNSQPTIISKQLLAELEIKPEKGDGEVTAPSRQKESFKEGDTFVPTSGRYKGKKLTWRNGEFHED